MLGLSQLHSGKLNLEVENPPCIMVYLLKYGDFKLAVSRFRRLLASRVYQTLVAMNPLFMDCISVCEVLPW